MPAAENPPDHKIRLGSRKWSSFQGNLKRSIFIKHKLKFRLPVKFQVACLIPALFAFAPHAGAGTRLATQKQALLWRSCFNFVKTNPSNEGFVFTPQKLVLIRRPRFLCFAKERKQRKATAGTGLLRKLPSLRAVFWAGSQLAATPLRACKPLFPEKLCSVRLCQQRGIDPTVCI